MASHNENEKGKAKFSKKKITKWSLIAGGVVVVFAAAIFLFPKGGGQALSAVVLSATAQKSSLQTTVTGTGNLETGTTSEILLPSGLEVLDVQVESGEHVSAGDVLATFSSASVQSKLLELQEQLEALDEQIDSTKGDTDSTTIKTYLSGRVKKIYAAEDTSVANCMAENGALLLLSTDGKMAVRIETSAQPAVGSSVTVTLSDGSAKTGTVESCDAESCIITLTDDGPALGEAVTVADESGAQLGSGTLYIHQQMEITGYAGTIESVSVSENQKISAGKTLVSLKDMPASAEHQQLLAQREDLVQMIQTLSGISATGALKAQSSGTVVGVNLDTGSSSAAASSNSSSSYSYGYSGLGAQDTGSVDGVSLLSAGSAEASEIASLDGLSIAAPIAGERAQTAIEETSEYSGSISWEPADSVFQESTSYTAQVTLTAKAGYVFPQGFQPVVEGAEISDVSITSEQEANVLCFSATFPATQATPQPSESGTPAPSPSPSASASLPTPTASAEQSSTPATTAPYSNAGMGSIYSAYSAASSSTASSSSSDSEEDSIAAFTIASDTDAKLTVSIDELDILSVSAGQAASITFDAISGEVFEGTVTKVSESSENGSAQYSAEISLERAESMRIGMNATAVITVEEKQDALTIPVDALQESGNQVFVYTSLDSEGNPTGETQVQTGLSDGQNVEITSGLSEGDRVYYTQAISENGSDFMMSGMGGNPMGGDFQPPEGGGMGGGPQRQ